MGTPPPPPPLGVFTRWALTNAEKGPLYPCVGEVNRAEWFITIVVGDRKLNHIWHVAIDHRVTLTVLGTQFWTRFIHIEIKGL